MPNKTVNMVDVPSQGNVPVLYIDNGDGTFSQATTDSSSAVIGAQADAAASTDTGMFSLMAFIKRNLQRFTALLAVLPVALGQSTMANSFRVAYASDQTPIADQAATGAISAQNANPNGPTAATANSTVQITLNSASTVTIDVRGTYTGGLTPQVSIDGTNWVNLPGSAVFTVSSGNFGTSIGSGTTGIYRVETGGYAFFRISANAAVTGSATIILRASNNNGFGAVNLASIASASINLGNGVASGSLRVTNASDSTGQTSVVGTSASNSFTPYRSLTLINTGQLIKATAARIYFFDIKNTSAAIRYVKIYNKATAPTTGTDTPVYTIPLAPGEHFVYGMETGIVYGSAGLGIACTTGVADTDNTAPTAGDVLVTIQYV